MKMREQIDTGQEQIDTGQQPLKKFVSTKQKFAAKKLKNQAVNKKKDLAEKRQQNNVVEQFGTTLDNDPVENNSTHGSANRIANKSNPEVRRPGWNRQSGSLSAPSVPPPPIVFGADQPEPGPSRNVRMLKIGLGVLGGIALLLGSLASILYISKKRRKRRRGQNKNRAKSRSPSGMPPAPPHPQHMQYPNRPMNGEYSQYPPNGWQNSLHPYGAQMANYSQLPYPGQVPFHPYQYQEQLHYQMAQGFYPMNYHEMAHAAYLQSAEAGYCNGNGNGQYPESQGDVSEVGFDPVLNYVETLGDELKTPKRRPKQRKEGSSTPHPIITRRASCKSLKSEVSAWTEDEDTASKAESTYVSQENLSLKVSGSNSGKEEGPVCNCDSGCTHEKDSTKSSPQLSQTNDSAYGSRGSIQSPNSNPLIIPPFANPPDQVTAKGAPSVQNVPSITQYMMEQFNRGQPCSTVVNRPMLAMSARPDCPVAPQLAQFASASPKIARFEDESERQTTAA